MALDKCNMQNLGTLEEMLGHPSLPEVLERLAQLHDISGNPFAMTTDADVARALAFRISEYQANNKEGDDG